MPGERITKRVEKWVSADQWVNNQEEMAQSCMTGDPNKTAQLLEFLKKNPEHAHPPVGRPKKSKEG